LVAGSASFDLLNTTATTINFGGAATTLNIGNAAGTVTIAGNLTVNGITTTINSSTVTVDDKNLELGVVVAGVISATGTVGTISGSGPWTAVLSGMTTTAGLVVGSSLTATASGGSLFGGSPTSVLITSIDSATQVTYQVTGGTTPTAGAVTNVTTTNATDNTANGGGITLRGATNKTIIWDSINSNWTASEHWNIATGKSFKINNVEVLNATTLGSGVTSSSLTSVGTLSGLTVGTNPLQINNVELQLAPTTTARVFKRAVQPGTISANTAQTIDSWLIATYRSAKYLIQVVQGGRYELHEYRFVHDNSAIYATQYAVLETDSGAPIPLTLAASITGGTLTVTATITNASTTNVTITMERTLFAV
jgi:hypothetical protein